MSALRAAFVLLASLICAGLVGTLTFAGAPQHQLAISLLAAGSAFFGAVRFDWLVSTEK